MSEAGERGTAEGVSLCCWGKEGVSFRGGDGKAFPFVIRRGDLSFRGGAGKVFRWGRKVVLCEVRRVGLAFFGGAERAFPFVVGRGDFPVAVGQEVLASRGGPGGLSFRGGAGRL